MTAYRNFSQIPWGRYGLIMADPPWRFATWSAKGKEKSPEKEYECLGEAEIKALGVAHLAAEDSLLWLWATAPMIQTQMQVISAWGFVYKTMGYWAKRSKTWKPGTKDPKWAFGTGYHLRCAGEPFLLATRGKPKTARHVRSVIEAAAREHSRKPDEAFAAAEALVPDVARLELFSRQERPGWDAYGDEVQKFGT